MFSFHHEVVIANFSSCGSTMIYDLTLNEKKSIVSPGGSKGGLVKMTCLNTRFTTWLQVLGMYDLPLWEVLKYRNWLSSFENFCQSMKYINTWPSVLELLSLFAIDYQKWDKYIPLRWKYNCIWVNQNIYCPCTSLPGFFLKILRCTVRNRILLLE